MTEMYDNPQHIEDTFTESNLSEYLLQAQWAEFVELKKAIVELYNKKKSPLKVLDIGIGNARVLKHLVGIKEIWDGPFPMSGSGRCHYESVPYCPKCEEKPNIHGSPIRVI